MIEPSEIFLFYLSVTEATFKENFSMYAVASEDFDINADYATKLNISLLEEESVVEYYIAVEGESRYHIDGVPAQEMILSAEFHFNVGDLEDHLGSDQQGNSVIDEELGSALFGIAYSTMRGIIYQQTRGSIFERNPLPVCDSLMMFRQSFDRGNFQLSRV